MPAAHHADGRLVERDALVALQQCQHRPHILSHRGGVAPGAVHPPDACLLHIGGVDVVVADGGGGHKAHLAAPEQLFVAPGACPHNQRVGVFHVLGVDFSSFLIYRIVSYTAYRLADIRYFVVDYDFHHSIQCLFVSVPVKKSPAPCGLHWWASCRDSRLAGPACGE